MVDPVEIPVTTLLVASDRVTSMSDADIVIDGGQTPGV